MSDPMDFDSIEGDDPSPEQKGVAVATVADNEDPEKQGRVKLSYPWRESDKDSDWARVATPMSGSKYGAYFLPEVGDAVLVAFKNGDIHHPYVIGSLWTGKQKPPEDNASGDNDKRVIKSRKGHSVEFDDNKSEAKVKIETEAGHKIVMNDKSGSEKITIEDKSGSNTITMDSAKGEISISGDKKISLSAKKVNISADSEVSISSKGKVTAEGKGKVKVDSKGQLQLKSSGIAKMKSSGIVQVKGSLIQLN